jgi:hypothetical protein
MWTLMDAVSKPSPPPQNRFIRSGFVFLDFLVNQRKILLINCFFQNPKKPNPMSVRTRHFHHAVEKIHHREIKDYQPEVITEEYPDYFLKISEGAISFQSKLSFKEIPKEDFEEEISFQENVETEEDIFEMEEISVSRQIYVADEEDSRFGDYSTNTFAGALINFFGGKVRQKLAFDSAMY